MKEYVKPEVQYVQLVADESITDDASVNTGLKDSPF